MTTRRSRALLRDPESWRDAANAAFGVLAKRQTAAAAAQAEDESEPQVRWVSTEGDDATADGSWAKPFRTYAAAVATWSDPATRAEFETFRVIRTRGVVHDGAGQPAVTFPCGRYAVELCAGDVFPQCTFRVKDSASHGSLLPPSLVFVGSGGVSLDGIGNRPQIAGSTATSIAIIPLLGDVPPFTCLAVRGVEVLGDVVEGNGLTNGAGAIDVTDSTVWGEIDAPEWYWTGANTLHLDDVTVFEVQTVRHCRFDANITVTGADNHNPGGSYHDPDSLLGFQGCTWNPSTGGTITVEGGHVVTMDLASVDSALLAGVTGVVAAGGAGVFPWAVHVRGISDDGDGTREGFQSVPLRPLGDVFNRAWVAKRGHDNPLKAARWGTVAYPFATLQAAIDHLHASEVSPPVDAQDYLSEVEIRLGPGEHPATRSYGISGLMYDVCTKGLVRIVCEANAKMPHPVRFTNLASLRFGEPAAPILEITSAETVGPVSPAQVGDDTNAIMIEGTAGDLASMRIRARNVRLRGAIVMDADYIAAGGFAGSLDLENCTVSGAITCPSLATNFRQSILSGAVSGYNLGQGCDRCHFQGSLTFADTPSLGAPTSTRRMLSNCTFEPGAFSITLPLAGSSLCMDDMTNASLVNAGWAVHPAGGLIEIRGGVPAIIPT